MLQRINAVDAITPAAVAEHLMCRRKHIKHSGPAHLHLRVVTFLQRAALCVNRGHFLPERKKSSASASIISYNNILSHITFILGWLLGAGKSNRVLVALLVQLAVVP